MSLLNGLSAMGQGIAAFAGPAGLEAQKADLAQQQLKLADQLATVRESSGRQEAGQIAAAAATQAQGATAANVATEQAGATGRTAMTEAGSMARTQATINAPPETIKLLRALGVPLPGDAQPATPAAGPRSGTAPAAPSGSAPDASSSNVSAPAASGSATTDLTNNPIVAKALGLGAPGSDAANRQAIASDVNNDPKFKGSTVGQRAAEIESRLAVAAGKMTDPESRNAMATAIASYQLAPLTNFALTKAGGPETMAKVIQLNPDYQEARYPEVSKAMSAFGSGKQGDVIRSLNVGVQHLAVIDQAGEAMKNNNVQALNSLQNMFEQQFGAPEPTTFNGLKQIVGTEIEKAVAGGIGASADRDRLMKALDSASSPAQLKSITDGFRALMIGQLSGLKSQYEDGTGFKTGPFAFENKLVPETKTALGLRSGGSEGAAAQPAAKPAAGPKPPAVGDVMQGFKFMGGDPANQSSWAPQ